MAKRRSRHEDHEDHENHERWLITYADMITLLMAFFIMLFAMSQLDLAKFAKFRDAMVNHFGGTSSSGALTGGRTPMDGGPAPVPIIAPDTTKLDMATQALAEKEASQAAAAKEKEAFTAAEDVIKKVLGAKGLGDRVQFHLEERGLIVSVVTDQVLFDLGAADLRPDGKVVLDALAVALADLPNDMVIEGHTDDQPIRGGQYPSNWELSTARATSVLRYLIVTHGLPANRLSAAGYADQRPLVPNASEQNRAQNRRVEIVVLAGATKTT